MKITKWGPKKLRNILVEIEDALNDRTAIAGEGINVSQESGGFTIATKAASAGDGSNSGGGASGTSANYSGANNGAPAVFHLLQSSAPSAP